MEKTCANDLDEDSISDPISTSETQNSSVLMTEQHTISEETKEIKQHQFSYSISDPISTSETQNSSVLMTEQQTISEETKEIKQHQFSYKIFEDLSSSVDSPSDSEHGEFVSPEHTKPPHQDHTYSMGFSSFESIKTYTRITVSSSIDTVLSENLNKDEVQSEDRSPSRSPSNETTSKEITLPPSMVPYVRMERLKILTVKLHTSEKNQQPSQESEESSSMPELTEFTPEQESVEETLIHDTYGEDVHPTTPPSTVTVRLQSEEDDFLQDIMRGISRLRVDDSEINEERKSSHFKYGRPTDTRVKRRRNYCPYCDKMVMNFSRHLVDMHSDQKEVKDYVALSSESPRTRKRLRAALTSRIRNMGNFKHNREIVEGERSGSFLPVKYNSHGKGDVNRFTHVTCKHCLGFLKKKLFYRHLQNCPGIVDIDSGGDDDDGGEEVYGTPLRRRRKKTVLRKHSELLVKDHGGATNLLSSEVFPKMQRDDETVVVQGDSLISRYGSNFRFTHRGTKHVYYCSSRMRTLARLFLTMQKLKPDLKEFRDCISPNNFDLLVEAVRRMSQFDRSSGFTEKPSVPPRLCSSLKSCANIVKSEAIKDESLSREEKTETMREMDDFLHLMTKDWSVEVSTNSEKSRKEMRVMKDDLLPEPDDIRTFSRYIHRLCPVYVSALKRMPNHVNYDRLAKIIIGHIITLNRRRPNETVEIPLEAYRSTLNRRCDYGYDTHSVLTEEELRSGMELSIFYVPANKNLKKVPILLTKEFHEAIEALIASREALGIKSKYLFARPGLGATKPFDGSAVLRSLANSAGLKNPSTFTPNALRHHAATSSQLMPRNETYTKRLSKFLGHDLSTHEHYYEMPLPLVQKSIVGHQLLKMILPNESKTKKKSNREASCTVTSGALSQANESRADGSAVGEAQRQESSNEKRIKCSNSRTCHQLLKMTLPNESKTSKKSNREVSCTVTSGALSEADDSTVYVSAVGEVQRREPSNEKRVKCNNKRTSGISQTEDLYVQDVGHWTASNDCSDGDRAQPLEPEKRVQRRKRRASGISDTEDIYDYDVDRWTASEDDSDDPRRRRRSNSKRRGKSTEH